MYAKAYNSKIWILAETPAARRPGHVSKLVQQCRNENGPRWAGRDGSCAMADQAISRVSMKRMFGKRSCVRRRFTMLGAR